MANADAEVAKTLANAEVAKVLAEAEVAKVKAEAEIAKARAEAENEIKLLASFDHPNIVTYRESFFEHGKLHIVMEYPGHDSILK